MYPKELVWRLGVWAVKWWDNREVAAGTTPPHLASYHDCVMRGRNLFSVSYHKAYH